jgi:hypothetical protein
MGRAERLTSLHVAGTAFLVVILLSNMLHAARTTGSACSTSA